MSEARSAELRAVLRGSPLFAGLSDRDLDDLLEIARSATHPPEYVVMQRGEEPDRICAIVSGRARVTATSANGREMTLRLLEAGSVCGEVAVFDGQVRTANVVSETEIELLVIERGRFRRYVHDHPNFALSLLDTLAGKLRETSSQLEESVFLGTEERLARTLLRLAAAYGEDEPDGSLRLTLQFAQEDIANLAGCVRESANRRFRQWVKEEIISFDRGELRIHNRDALNDIAIGLG